MQTFDFRMLIGENLLNRGEATNQNADFKITRDHTDRHTHRYLHKQETVLGFPFLRVTNNLVMNLNYVECTTSRRTSSEALHQHCHY